MHEFPLGDVLVTMKKNDKVKNEPNLNVPNHEKIS